MSPAALAAFAILCLCATASLASAARAVDVITRVTAVGKKSLPGGKVRVCVRVQSSEYGPPGQPAVPNVKVQVTVNIQVGSGSTPGRAFLTTDRHGVASTKFVLAAPPAGRKGAVDIGVSPTQLKPPHATSSFAEYALPSWKPVIVGSPPFGTLSC